MELASESMSLVALPQTDSSEETARMPKNRSAAFATNAEEYFRTLNVSLEDLVGHYCRTAEEK